MLKFRKIEIEDIEIFKKLTKNNNEISCENAFVNLYVWQNVYNNKIAVKDNTLYIKSVEENGKKTFRLPIGGNLEKGLKEIFCYCKNQLPDFWNPVGESFHRLPLSFTEKYSFHEERDAFDYVYLQTDLANLQGKKYHGKRNHINAFSKKHNWHFEKITEKNKSAVISCAEKWYNENLDRLDKYMQCEKQGIYAMLQNMEKLEISGGAIFVEGEVVAFTLGSEINKNVFDVHIEKALKDFGEAYTVINNEFAKVLTNYKYINREDDMGLEGLRKAKLSYKPEIMVKKYFCTPKEQI